MTALENARRELKQSLRDTMMPGVRGDFKDGIVHGIEHCLKILDTIRDTERPDFSDDLLNIANEFMDDIKESQGGLG